MAFRVIYYISLACPTVERALEMLEKYIQAGANRCEIDMRAHDPDGEPDAPPPSPAGDQHCGLQGRH